MSIIDNELVKLSLSFIPMILMDVPDEPHRVKLIDSGFKKRTILPLRPDVIYPNPKNWIIQRNNGMSIIDNELVKLSLPFIPGNIGTSGS